MNVLMIVNNTTVRMGEVLSHTRNLCGCLSLNGRLIFPRTRETIKFYGRFGDTFEIMLFGRWLPIEINLINCRLLAGKILWLVRKFDNSQKKIFTKSEPPSFWIRGLECLWP